MGADGVIKLLSDNLVEYSVLSGIRSGDFQHVTLQKQTFELIPWGGKCASNLGHLSAGKRSPDLK